MDSTAYRPQNAIFVSHNILCTKPIESCLEKTQVQYSQANLLLVASEQRGLQLNFVWLGFPLNKDFFDRE